MVQNIFTNIIVYVKTNPQAASMYAFVILIIIITPVLRKKQIKEILETDTRMDHAVHLEAKKFKDLTTKEKSYLIKQVMEAVSDLRKFNLVTLGMLLFFYFMLITTHSFEIIHLMWLLLYIVINMLLLNIRSKGTMRQILFNKRDIYIEKIQSVTLAIDKDITYSDENNHSHPTIQVVTTQHFRNIPTLYSCARKGIKVGERVFVIVSKNDLPYTYEYPKHQ